MTRLSGPSGVLVGSIAEVKGYEQRTHIGVAAETHTRLGGGRGDDIELCPPLTTRRPRPSFNFVRPWSPRTFLTSVVPALSRHCCYAVLVLLQRYSCTILVLSQRLTSVGSAWLGPGSAIPHSLGFGMLRVL